MELIVGTKVWSTWSMRPWLVMRRFGIPFTETLITLRQENNMTGEAIAPFSPSRLVPALRDGELVVWDSLAICEYLAERHAGLWPADPAMRALCRSAAAEMHSGFGSLRSECPMDLAATPARAELSEATRENVARIVALWTDLLARSGGPFLGGGFSIADAFYTPTATRLRTYGVPLEGAAAAYCERLLSTPEFLQWEREALA